MYPATKFKPWKAALGQSYLKPVVIRVIQVRKLVNFPKVCEFPVGSIGSRGLLHCRTGIPCIAGKGSGRIWLLVGKEGAGGIAERNFAGGESGARRGLIDISETKQFCSVGANIGNVQ